MFSRFRFACLVVLALLCAAGLWPVTYTWNYPSAVLKQTGYQKVTVGGGGDTWTMGGWTKAADCAGSFAGGCLLTTYNDGNSSIGIYKITNIDYVNPANTSISSITQLAGYGNQNINLGACQGGSGWSWHGDAVFMRHSIMYVSIACSNTGSGQRGAAGMICSKDMGSTWTNYTHWTSNGGACRTSGDVNGDLPANVGGSMQWPGSGPTDTTVQMNFIRPIQMCQDMTVSCPTPSWADPLYDYFFGWNGAITATYVTRILKTDDAMDPSKWSCVSVYPTTPIGSPTWTTNTTSGCVGIPYTSSIGAVSTYPYSMIWDGTRIIGLGKLGNGWFGGEAITYFTAPSPWFGWSGYGTVIPTSAGFPVAGWPGLSLGTLSQVSPDRYSITMAANGTGPEYTLHFQQFTIESAPPVSYWRTAIPNCAQSTWQFSDVLIPGLFPSRGLASFSNASDGCGITGSALTSLTDGFTGLGWTCVSGSAERYGMVSGPNCASPASFSIPQNGPFTMMVVWQGVGTGADSNTVGHIQQGSDYAQMGWRCGNYGGCSAANNQIYFRLYTASANKYTDVLQTTATITTAGAWHFIAFSKPSGILDANTASMYVDGVKVPVSRAGDTGATTATWPAMSSGWSLFHSGGGNVAVGAVYTTQLTDQEMLCSPGPGNCGVYKLLKAKLATRGIGLP
jgi:hypothetical protein